MFSVATYTHDAFGTPSLKRNKPSEGSKLYAHTHTLSHTEIQRSGSDGRELVPRLGGGANPRSVCFGFRGVDLLGCSCQPIASRFRGNGPALGRISSSRTALGSGWGKFQSRLKCVCSALLIQIPIHIVANCRWRSLRIRFVKTVRFRKVRWKVNPPKIVKVKRNVLMYDSNALIRRRSRQRTRTIE